jgi:hypothetical protein
MLTIGQAQKYAVRATSLAYPSVIAQAASGPLAIALDQSGEGLTAAAPIAAVLFDSVGLPGVVAMRSPSGPFVLRRRS